MTFHFPFDYGSLRQKSGFSSVLLILNCLLSDPIFLVLVSFGRLVGTFFCFRPTPKNRKQKPEIIMKTNKSFGRHQHHKEAVRGIKIGLRESGRKKSQSSCKLIFLPSRAPPHHFKGEISWLQIEGNQICGCYNDCRFSYSDQSFYAHAKYQSGASR